MGITVAEPCFDSENDSSAKLCAEGSERFEHLLLRPVSDPQTDCSDDATAAPRHSTVLLESGSEGGAFQLAIARSSSP